MTIHADAQAYLSIDRRFAAPPATVFRHWADTRLRQIWWGPKEFACTALASDFRPGGGWSATIVAPAQGPYDMAGIYREIVPDSRIVFTFCWTSDPEPRETIVTVTLRPTAGGGTLQTFRQGPFDTASDRDSHAEGWGECLDRQVAAIGGAA